MICVSYTDSATNRLIKLPDEFINETSEFGNKWVHLVNPSDSEVDFISSKTGIQEDFLKYALDEEERSRIEKEDGTLMVLVDIPVVSEDEDSDYYSYTTYPFSIIAKGDYLVTVCLKDSAVTKDFFRGRVKNVEVSCHSRTTFQILFQIASKYLYYLRQIDKASQKVQGELHKTMKNKELIELLDIQNSLVYFSTSLRGNATVIERLCKTNVTEKKAEEQDLIEDVAIENSQAIEMCNIYRDILGGTMNAFSSVINNNLNVVMKVLTAITLILSVPTLIASLFGMNLGGIPGEHEPWGFGIVTGIAMLLAGIIALILHKKKMM